MGNPIGIINEQGYPASNGLGFTPLNEEQKSEILKELEKNQESNM